MTNDEIEEAIAICVNTELVRRGGESYYNYDLSRTIAADVMAMVGPKKLVWVKHYTNNVWKCTTSAGIYRVFADGPVSWDFDEYHGLCITATAKTCKAAKDAAQSYYDAAHWDNTVIAGGHDEK